MPAEFENGVFGANKAAWHGLGTVVEDDVLTAAQVIEHVPQLGMHVELVPAFASFNGQALATDSFCTVREDGVVLGSGLSKSYAPVQSFEAFDWMDNLMGDGEERTAKYHTAGTLCGGAIAWMLAKFNEGVKIGGLEDETIDFYLLVGNRFDGHGALFAKFVKERVVCKNTFDVARGESGNEVRIWHTASAERKMEQAAQVLGLFVEQREQTITLGEQLIAKKMTEKQFSGFLTRLIPLPKGANPDKDRAARNKQEARDAITDLFANSENLQNVRGTAWAAFNAVTEYVDHTSSTRTRTKGDETAAAENRFKKLLLNEQPLKTRAAQLLVTA